MAFFDNQVVVIAVAVLAIVLFLKREEFEFFDPKAAPAAGKPLDDKLIDKALANIRSVSTPKSSDALRGDLSEVQPSAPSSQAFGGASVTDGYTLGTVVDPKYAAVTPAPQSAKLTAKDLLPKSKNPDWFDNPNSDFNLQAAVAMEVPEYKMGIDTVGQSRKNASLDLRAAPPCPKFVVSPWNNSTIEPDYNIRPLC